MPKYLTKTEFKRLNNRAIKQGYNRSVYRKAYDIINEDDLLPIGFSLDHSHTNCIRCQIAITDKVQVWLDIAYQDYDKLDTYNYEDTHNAETRPFTTTDPTLGLRLGDNVQVQDATKQKAIRVS
jgi:hypothetical protein